MRLFLCSVVALMVITNSQTLDTTPKPKELIKNSPLSRSLFDSCVSDDIDDTSVACYGLKIVRRIIKRVVEYIIDLQNMFSTDGIDLTDDGNHENLKKSKILDKTSFMELLKNKNYRIRLNNFLFNQKPSNDSAVETGRGKSSGLHHKSGGNILLTALLLGLGLLAMKALVASSLALMLSLLMTIKKHHGHEGYSEHRRRRYSLEPESSPYRGWSDSYKRR